MRFALLGDPVAHSLSPAIHGAALSALGIHGRYEARRVDRRGLLVACTEVREQRLAGANVTMPWKAEAAAACDLLSPEAAVIGAANTLSLDGGRLRGDVTDVDAIRAALSRLPGGRVVVLGAGATAAAALVAAEGRNVTVAARRLHAAAELVERVGVAAQVGAWGAPAVGAIVVNATPLGMQGEALPEAVLDGCLGLVDLPYGASPTPSVEAARESGVPVVDGVDVLVAQAAASFEIWTGLPAPVDVMERAARSR